MGYASKEEQRQKDKLNTGVEGHTKGNGKTFKFCGQVLKKDSSPQMESLVLSSMSANQDLMPTLVSASPEMES